MTNTLKIYEVGPRDGLQNEAVNISTENKKRLIDGLVRAGLRSLELTRFGSDIRAPQIADAEEIMTSTLENHGDDNLELVGLIFNEKGYERAYKSGCRSIAIGAAVSI